MALERSCEKIREGKLLAFSEKNIQSLTIFKTFIHGDHYAGECSGAWGWQAQEQEACSYTSIASPSVLKLCTNRLWLLLLLAWRTSPGIVLTPWRQLWVGWACAGGAVVGSSASVPGQAGVALRAVWYCKIIFGFYFYYFESPFSLSLLASLPPKCVQ